jgi:RHS repeat-associated protein
MDMDIQTRAGAMNRTMKRLLWLMVLWGGVAHANTVTYIYTDPQGTPLAEANASGVITATYDYAPYGSQAMGAAHDGPGYTGHVNDADTGLVYMQARYYDPAAGRFISTDPDGLAAGNPYNFNRFAYANNNPVVNMDPDGRMTGSLTRPDVAGVAGSGYVEQIAPVRGNAQKSSNTPTHASTSRRVADEAAREADTKTVHLNQSLRTVTGDPNAPNVRPDVTIVKNNGDIHQVEIRSAGQTPAELQAKMATVRIGLGAPGRDILMEPDMPATRIGAFGTIGVIEMIFHEYVNHVVEERSEEKMTPGDREWHKECQGRECI